MSRQRGFNTIIVIVLVVISIGAASFWVYSSNKQHDDGWGADDTAEHYEELIAKQSADEQEIVESKDNTSNTDIQSKEADKDAPVSTQKVSDGFQTYLIRPSGIEQTSPVTTKVQSDKHVMSLQLRCETSPCKFRLGSDTYPLGNQKTYSGAQTINYTLDKKGSWVFYNDLNPVTKFQIVIE